MLGNNMKQQGGDGSNNIQVNGNMNVGVSYESARQIALDVFKANFYDFTEKAAQKAMERAEEMTEKLVNEFFDKIPHLSHKLEEPSIQSSMFNAQKEYAKTGDKELEGQLLDLLINRIDSEERSLKQIVLDEAILVLPKLTKEHVNILTLILSAVHLNHPDVRNIHHLKDLINNRVLCFYPEKFSKGSFITHLQSSGCCVILSEGATYKPLEELYRERFKGLLNKGFSEQEFREKVDMDEYLPKYKSLLVRCLQNPIAVQFNAINDEVLSSEIEKFGFGNKAEEIKKLFDETTMSVEEVRQFFISANPRSEKLFKDWKETDMKSMSLTPVGYAIAIMNFNKHTGLNVPLQVFLDL